MVLRWISHTLCWNKNHERKKHTEKVGSPTLRMKMEDNKHINIEGQAN